MKVLFCTYPTAFQNPGGGEIVLLKLREFLRRQGTEVDLFDPWVTKFGEYDIVHCFSRYTGSLWPEIKVQGARVVVTPILLPQGNRWSLFRARVRTIIKQCLMPSRFRLSLEHQFSFVDMLLPNSKVEAAAIKRWYRFRDDAIAVVPNGVDECFLTGDDSFPRKFGLGNYILTTGRIAPNKNQLTLIRAARRAGIRLAIVGRPDAAESAYYEACVREAGDDVLFAGYIPHDDPLLRSAFRCATAFVLPSFAEIASLVLLEAGLAGTQVLTTDVGAAREYLGDLASFIDPSSEQDIAERIMTAMRTPRSDRLREHVRRHYLWQTVAAQTAAAYASVVASPAGTL